MAREDVGAETQQAKRRRTHTRGTIVRIKLRNFMSYSECELFADPGKLNCIIGPNGEPMVGGERGEAVADKVACTCWGRYCVGCTRRVLLSLLLGSPTNHVGVCNITQAIVQLFE